MATKRKTTTTTTAKTTADPTNAVSKTYNRADTVYNIRPKDLCMASLDEREIIVNEAELISDPYVKPTPDRPIFYFSDGTPVIDVWDDTDMAGMAVGTALGNRRIDYGNIEDLATSFAKVGQLNHVTADLRVIPEEAASNFPGAVRFNGSSSSGYFKDESGKEIGKLMQLVLTDGNRRYLAALYGVAKGILPKNFTLKVLRTNRVQGIESFRTTAARQLEGNNTGKPYTLPEIVSVFQELIQRENLDISQPESLVEVITEIYPSIDVQVADNVLQILISTGGDRKLIDAFDPDNPDRTVVFQEQVIKRSESLFKEAEQYGYSRDKVLDLVHQQAERAIEQGNGNRNGKFPVSVQMIRDVVRDLTQAGKPPEEVAQKAVPKYAARGGKVSKGSRIMRAVATLVCFTKYEEINGTLIPTIDPDDFAEIMEVLISPEFGNISFPVEINVGSDKKPKKVPLTPDLQMLMFDALSKSPRKGVNYKGEEIDFNDPNNIYLIITDNFV